MGFKWTREFDVSVAAAEIAGIRIEGKAVDTGAGIRWETTLFTGCGAYNEWGTVDLIEDAESECEAAASHGLATKIRGLGYAVGYLDCDVVVSADGDEVVQTIEQPDGTHRVVAYPFGRQRPSVELASGIRSYHIDGLAIALAYLRRPENVDAKAVAAVVDWKEIPQDNGEFAYVAHWPLDDDFDPMEICVVGWRGGSAWSHDYAHDGESWFGDDRSFKGTKEEAMSAALAGANAEAAKLRAEFAPSTSAVAQ